MSREQEISLENYLRKLMDSREDEIFYLVSGKERGFIILKATPALAIFFAVKIKDLEGKPIGALGLKFINLILSAKEDLQNLRLNREFIEQQRMIEEHFARSGEIMDVEVYGRKDGKPIKVSIHAEPYFVGGKNVLTLINAKATPISETEFEERRKNGMLIKPTAREVLCRVVEWHLDREKSLEAIREREAITKDPVTREIIRRYREEEEQFRARLNQADMKPLESALLVRPKRTKIFLERSRFFENARQAIEERRMELLSQSNTLQMHGSQQRNTPSENSDTDQIDSRRKFLISITQFMETLFKQ